MNEFSVLRILKNTRFYLHICSEKRRGYKHAIDGLMRIVKDEGVRILWSGAIPTMGRAAIVNGAQLGTYSRSKMFLKDTGLQEFSFTLMSTQNIRKRTLLKSGEYSLFQGHLEEGLLVQFLAGMIAGIVAASASLPMDIAKTRWAPLLNVRLLGNFMN